MIDDRDDLDRALGRWADATAPTADAITGADVRATARSGRADAAPLPRTAEDPDVADLDLAGDDDRGPTPVRPARRRRGRTVAPLALAAALLLVAAVVARWRTTDDSDERVTTDPTTSTEVDAAAGVRTQVVVESLPGGAFGETVERLEIVDGGGERVLADPVQPGTSLVLDQALPVGSATLRWEVMACGPRTCRTRPDGRPAEIDPVPAAAACDVRFEVGPAPTLIVVRAEVDASGAADCSLQPTDPAPTLTVPPGWSRRDRLPWTCGTEAWDAGTLAGPADPDAATEAWECLLDAAEHGRPVELPTSEIGPADDVRRVWWRVVPDEPEPVQVLRAPWMTGGDGGWTIQRCARVVETFADGGEATAGCDEPEVLPLDLPPLTDRPPTDPSQEDAPDVVPLRLVVRAGTPPASDEGVVNRWVVEVDGAPLDSGPVTFATAHRETALVSEVEVAPGTSIDLVWELYDCPASCPTVGADGAPVDEAFEPFATCVVTGVEATAADPVVVLSLSADDERTCVAETRAEVPHLTVPPGWSLRRAFDPLCGDDWAASMPADPLYEGAPSPSRDARRCLVRRFEDGASAEMASAERLADGSIRPVTFRIGPGRVEVVVPADPSVDRPWTHRVCTGLSELDVAPWIEATGCGPEEEMPLTPP